MLSPKINSQGNAIRPTSNPNNPPNIPMMTPNNPTIRPKIAPPIANQIGKVITRIITTNRVEELDVERAIDCSLLLSYKNRSTLKINVFTGSTSLTFSYCLKMNKTRGRNRTLSIQGEFISD